MNSPRPLLSGSMALHCPRANWFAFHGYEGEPVLPSAQRTFDLGHIIEAAMLQGILDTDQRTRTDLVIDPWWGDLGTLTDPVSGQSFVASMDQLSDFQRTVKFAGLEGHIDCLVKLESGLYVMDVKSTQGFGFDRHQKSELMDDDFAREYVGQLHFYIAGLRHEGLDIKGGILLFFNKEQSNVMPRFVPYDENLTKIILRKLTEATKDEMAPVDWDWIVGDKLPLRCSYCPYKAECAKSRDVRLELMIEKGKPKWRVNQ